MTVYFGSKKAEKLIRNPGTDNDQRSLLRSPVNLTSVADVMQINASLLLVEFVKDAVIAYSQLKFRSALQSLMWKIR
jgi:hypothetical protein